MLLTNVAYWDSLAVAIDDVSAKDTLSFKNALRVVSKSSMPDITECLLGFVEPVVNCEVVFGSPAPVSYATLSVEDWTGHSAVSSYSHDMMRRLIRLAGHDANSARPARVAHIGPISKLTPPLACRNLGTLS
jgi:hypothetical protein